MSQEEELIVESESEDGGVLLSTSNINYHNSMVEFDPAPHTAMAEDDQNEDSVQQSLANQAHGDIFHTVLIQNAVQSQPQNIVQPQPQDDAQSTSTELEMIPGPGGGIVFPDEDEDVNTNPWITSDDAVDSWNLDPTLGSSNGPPASQPLNTAVHAAFDDGGDLTTDAVAETGFSMPFGGAVSGETLPIEPDIFGDLDHGTGFQGVVHSPFHLHEVDRLNCPIETFFTFWRLMWSQSKPNYPPISVMADYRGRNPRPKKITPHEMAKEKCDHQGIYWSRYQVTKEQARDVRRMLYRNHVNMNTDIEQEREDWGKEAYKISFTSDSSPAIPSIESYFRFRETSAKQRIAFRHYQLRHNISATSQNAIYYNRGGSNGPLLDPVTGLLHSQRNFTIMCYNPQSDSEDIVMNASKIKAKNVPILDKIATLSADHDVLVVGSMSGVYGMKSLSTTNDTPITVGAITRADGDISTDNSTNHIHTMLSRQSGLPQAVFSSNDYYVRILDCTSNRWMKKHRFNSPVNCSVTDPSGRLRLLVCDDEWPVVADAETGEQLAKLPGHTDHGFACAWAPDGITMATGHQDGIVQVWDARQLKEAVARIPAEQSGVRAMQFSPLGSGKPVLVLAEPADFVHIVDADTWASKQTIEFFGEVAGITITPDGRSLYIANADTGFGGLMEFERTGLQSGEGWKKGKRRLVREELSNVLDKVYEDDEERKEGLRSEWGSKYGDWTRPELLDGEERCLAARGQRLRRHMGLANLII